MVVDGGRLGVFQNEFGVLGAPFLASGYDGIRKIVTSDLFEGWVTQLHDGSGPACRSCPSTGGRASGIC